MNETLLYQLGFILAYPLGLGLYALICWLADWIDAQPTRRPPIPPKTAAPHL